MSKRFPLLATPAALLASAFIAAGCGSSESGDYGGPHPDYAKTLAGSPPALAALHHEENELLPGGTDAFEKRLASLHGYPVVANVWASWCVPCRNEFPTLQKLSSRYGRKVAFLGINVEDSDDAAATFLREEPVPYPSFSDPDKEITESIGISGGYPDTAIYDASGKLVHLKLGQYGDASELEADVRRYALGSG